MSPPKKTVQREVVREYVSLINRWSKLSILCFSEEVDEEEGEGAFELSLFIDEEEPLVVDVVV